jgi:phage terminase large subunit-like protein
MTGGLTELMALFKEGKARHHNNPVARWCFDSVEVRKATYNRDLIRPEKPDRDSSKKRIDAVPSSSMATSAWVRKRVEPAKEEAFNIW